MSNYKKKTHDAIIEQLRTMGVTQAVVEYSGGGDSGGVDSIAACMKSSPPDTWSPIEVIEAAHEAAHPTSKVVAEVTAAIEGSELISMRKRIEELCYEALDHVNAEDWCNNDGGGGTMTIYVEDGEHNDEPVVAGTIKVEHYYNEITRHEARYELP